MSAPWSIQAAIKESSRRDTCRIHRGLMFEKGPRSALNLWVAERFVDNLVAEGSLEYRHAPSSVLFATKGANGKRRYGRHSALKVMNQFSYADLVCFRINRLVGLDRILDYLSNHDAR